MSSSLSDFAVGNEGVLVSIALVHEYVLGGGREPEGVDVGG